MYEQSTVRVCNVCNLRIILIYISSTVLVGATATSASTNNLTAVITIILPLPVSTWPSPSPSPIQLVGYGTVRVLGGVEESLRRG